ncbi:DUF742 domain-containing protein [Nocardia amikacinitolerans]|uniref:DUF742 domain-containing protein n=1 Tax=Nocardia amikacinitolerans TaxID=756689 RepID=A0A285L0C6_9NOCA|nr:DUF742 domain-containing protein [Nocardia amikacinitolerans]MCP2276027.1 Protein of unknown function (DUF742) [Nocardia amikacinitolerans]MCP2289570.1 Protein of unknown function (DUF742) [Nocardia amikacinitolerans]MCP2294298.1 Protein of unknown function (DUF742) [Nocardia amikacinitolerans]MCP2314814.1 Protein of unknown function (DUF742) [Nocardia amikacinitolerans]SNY76891.1 Protein of unknown function [Nocardia amikacinitolerans]
MTRRGEPWFDDAAGPLIRPYALTRGRTMGAGHDLDIVTVVVTASPAPTLRRPEPEYAEIVRLCRDPQSVAEVAANLKLPLAVTKILVGDLIGEGQLIFRAPVQTEAGPGDLNILRAVLDGIRKL